MADNGQNSIQLFMSHMMADMPSYSSLYHVEFSTLPGVLYKTDSNGRKLNIPVMGDKYSNRSLGLDQKLGRNLNYYASEISVPSRQITTGEQKSVGAMYRYPTSTTFSEVSMQFTLTRSLMTRTFFERWMNYISSDADQYTSYYDDCVCPVVKIYKIERGGGGKIPPKQGINPIIGTDKKGEPKRLQGFYNKVSGVWVLYNVFPFNISSFSLGNAQSQLINMEVTFYFERYRFHSLQEEDVLIDPSDTTQTTSSNIDSQKAAQTAANRATPVYNWNAISNTSGITNLAFNQQAALAANFGSLL